MVLVLVIALRCSRGIFAGYRQKAQGKSPFWLALDPRPKGRCYSEEQKQIPSGNDKKKSKTKQKRIYGDSVLVRCSCLRRFVDVGGRWR